MDSLSHKRIILAGGTGLVGRRLAACLAQEGAEVQVLTRRPEAARLPEGVKAASWAELPDLLEGAAAVVNLAGEGIADRRWTAARKQALWESRIGPTHRLVAAIERCRTRPSVLVNASAIGFYGVRSEPVDENAATGAGFLPELCQAWEAEARKAEPHGVRVVCLRIGVVLAREGGALPKMALPLKAFAGTVLGTGCQGFSWIHREDLARMIREALVNPEWSRAVNATAPESTTNAAFTRALARRLRRPVWPVPARLTRTLLRLMVGEMADPMLLGGALVRPSRALDLGFAFRFPTLAAALEDLA